MKTLNGLIREAAEAAKFRGHALTWARYTAEHARGTCTACGLSVAVRLKPAPNQIDIGGEAVALDCAPQAPAWTAEAVPAVPCACLRFKGWAHRTACPQAPERKPGEVWRDRALPARQQWRIMTHNGLWPASYRTRREAVEFAAQAAAMFAPGGPPDFAPQAAAVTKKPHFSHDGFGINGPDAHRTRLLSWATTGQGARVLTEAERQDIGALFVAAPLLLALVKQYRAEAVAQGADAEDIAEIDAALKAVGKGV